MLAEPLQRFLDIRSSLARQLVGGAGAELCSVLTEALDHALVDLARDLEPNTAVVALGGYGRGEQCLGSDVDVMLLHGGGDPERLVRAVLYPLWDSGLKVGHAVRTVTESAEAASDFETLTSLLSARLVAGDADLFEQLTSVVTDAVRKRPLASALVAQERIRRDRDPYPVMAADLKQGRGALRTHQGFWWERRRAELLGLRFDLASETENMARETLLAVRNALHAASGRASDRFVVDLREPAAAWLGVDVFDLAQNVVVALHAGDNLADRRWPDLHAEQDPMVGFGRRIFGAVQSRFSPPPADSRQSDGVLELAVAAAARKDGAWFEPFEEEQIRSTPSRDWTAGDRASFVSLLAAGARGRTVFGRLEGLGWIDREFPEWGPVATAPQLAPFHDHPVGAHLWRAADEMLLLIGERGETGEIAAALGSTEELLLAAFLHDIGKARGGSHAEVGAELAATFLRRVGFGPATVGLVSDVVRSHLLLSETATRRDIASSDVVDDVASQVGDLRRLQVLYLLTIADLRATGTTMWNEWRSTLIRSLYLRVRDAIEDGGATAATRDVDAIVAIAGDVDRREIEEHVAAMPDTYLDTTAPGEVMWHIAATRELGDEASITVDPNDPTRVLVVGADRTGFLLAVSRAFTANGLAILDARLRTRSDGIVVDTFHVGEDRTHEPVANEKWEKVRSDLVALLAGDVDLRSTIRERAETYRSVPRSPAAVEVKTRVAGRLTVVEVRAPDQIGLLNQIVEALFAEGLDIFLARVDTMGGQARDVFYVRNMGGAPIRADAELESLRSRLDDRLRART